MSVWSMIPSYLGILALVITGVNFKRERNERRSAQANKIAAWVQRSGRDGEPHKLIVKNASDLPCTDVCVWWTEGYKNPKAIHLSKTFGADTDRWRKPKYIHAVGPGATEPVYSTSAELAVRALEFRDAAGRLWVRRAEQLAERTRPSLRGRIGSWRQNRRIGNELKEIRARRAGASEESSQSVEGSHG